MTYGKRKAREVPMKKRSSKDPTLRALKRAAKGLVFVSETEAPLEPFVWQDGGELTQPWLRKLAGAQAGTPVEQMTVDDFFRAVPSEDKAKFQRLKKVLKEQLSGVHVYKLGEEADKEVFIAGKTADGRWAGVKTAVVET
jgi:histidine triad (HIT) family protein